MNEFLPDQWILTTIDEVTVNINQRQPHQDESFFYIDIGSIDRENKYISNPERILGKNAPSRARKVVMSGDILVSTTRPNLNAVALVPEKFNNQIASTGFDVLRTPNIDPRWLFYLVRTTGFVQAMSELVQGALYPAVRPRDIRSFEIPLAPLNEQKRIADKLDRLITRVDACREKCDRIPLILKRFRQSVLAAATSGELTEDWRESRGITQESWQSMIFKEACKEITVGFVGKMANQYRDEGIPFLRSLNVRPFRFDSKNLQFISSEFHRQIIKSRLQPGDVVVVRTGAPGQCCVIPDAIAEANCSDLVIVRPQEILLSGYACIFINSSQAQEFVRSEIVGVAQSHFNVGSMKITPLDLPTVKEQQEIVRRVETLFAFADRLEARYQTARAQCDQLTPALLEKAFRGELVPQDPNDEPASVLLERIQATRAKTEQPKRTPAKRKPKKP